MTQDTISPQVNSCEGVGYLEELFQRSRTERIGVALDTETTGLDWADPDTRIICYSVSAHPNRGAVIWLVEPEQVAGDSMFEGGWAYTKPHPARRYHLDLLAGLLESETMGLVMQHGTFDLHHIREELRRDGLPESPASSYIMDLQVAAHLIDEERFKFASLGQLNKEFGTPSDWKDGITHDWSKMAPGDIGRYAVQDAINTLEVAGRLFEILQKVPSLWNYFNKFAMPTTKEALYQLEANGVALNRDLMPETRFQIANEVERSARRLIELLPPKIKEAHPEPEFTNKNLIREVFFGADGFALNSLARTATGTPSVNKDALVLLKHQKGLSASVGLFIKTYEEWSSWSGLLGRSFSQLESFVKQDGRVHSNYTLCSAVTGRVASSGPNMMNLVERGQGVELIKRLICVPNEGSVLLEIDFSQAELRWASHIANDLTMQGIYLRGEDIHTATAKGLTKDYDSLTEAEKKIARSKAKAVNFGILYGMGPYGLSNQCLASYDLVVSLDEAKEMIKKWFETYPAILRWQKETAAFLEKNGYVESPLGRRRWPSKIKSSNPSERKSAIRQAVNAPIQSASSDTALLALVEILRDKEIPKAVCKPILFVHDSLTFEVKRDYLQDMAAKIYQHLVHPPLKEYFGVDLLVPLDVDMAVGPNKAEMKPFKIC